MQKNKILSDVVAQGPSKSRYMKNVDGYFFPEQYPCSGKQLVKRGLSVSKTAMGLWSCNRERAVKGACAVTAGARRRR